MRIIGLLLLLATLVLSCGRTTLAPDGPYQGDKFLYESDRTLVESKKTFEEFIDWTRANASQLQAAGRKDVIGTAEHIQTNAPGWFFQAYSVRAVYTNAVGSGYSRETISMASNSLWLIVNTIQKRSDKVPKAPVK